MPRCSFCTSDMEEGTGKLLVLKTGKPYFFCSRRCERFLMRGTSAKRLKWTKAKK